MRHVRKDLSDVVERAQLVELVSHGETPVRVVGEMCRRGTRILRPDPLEPRRVGAAPQTDVTVGGRAVPLTNCVSDEETMPTDGTVLGLSVIWTPEWLCA